MEIAGGHIDKFNIIEEGKKLVKTVKSGELEFYEEVNKFQQEEIVKDLQKMIPSYYGIYQLEPIPQIILQNLLLDFKNPSILDVKMGFETFVPNATEKKRNSHISKMQKTTSHSLGLRISGMIVHDMEGRYKVKWNRGSENGMYTISKENIQDSNFQSLGFTEFLTVGDTISTTAAA